MVVGTCVLFLSWVQHLNNFTTCRVGTLLVNSQNTFKHTPLFSYRSDLFLCAPTPVEPVLYAINQYATASVTPLNCDHEFLKARARFFLSPSSCDNFVAFRTFAEVCIRFHSPTHIKTNSCVACWRAVAFCFSGPRACAAGSSGRNRSRQTGHLDFFRSRRRCRSCRLISSGV